MTKQKELIYRIVKNSKEHMTAEQVFCAAKEQMDSIVRATVYNNLNALTVQGLIRRIRILGLLDRYDYAGRPHDHLVCDRCGAITDISISGLAADLERKSGVKLNYYELNMHYTCEVCKKQDSDAKKHHKIMTRRI